ncbi:MULTISPECIES: VanZ family protein [Bacillaceae]|uniref:VanZ family protein n=1 Tax=Bacillaceae TaxID=186817 RepID=UPI00118C2261|nr:VanZ family protein [Bacillus sp. S3]QCJ44223.1 VanZ family protein [Bacillus sp. S3]
MRGLLILVWGVVIFIFTCTASFHSLIEFGVIGFEWDSRPHFAELLFPLPAALSGHFLLQKLGHLTAFFIFTFLLHTKFQSRMLALIIATSYAALTEFLQLYFTRDGRLFDIGIDGIGVLLAVGVSSFSRRTQFDKSA